MKKSSLAVFCVVNYFLIWNPYYKKINITNQLVQGAAEQTTEFGGVSTRAVVGLSEWMWSHCDRSLTPQVDIMIWTGEHRGLAERAYFEISKSVIMTQRAFCRRFIILRNNADPDGNTIQIWVKRLEETGSMLKIVNMAYADHKCCVLREE